MSTICKNCGATVSDEETHCPYCDSPIGSGKHIQEDSPTQFESYENDENQEDWFYLFVHVNLCSCCFMLVEFQLLF